MDLSTLRDATAADPASLNDMLEPRLTELAGESSKRLRRCERDRRVTELRLMEETLDKLRSEVAHAARVVSLGALAASIAHEVRQPLSGIITNASACLRMLETGPVDLARVRQTAQGAIRDARRACDVITRLRDMVDKRPPNVETIDLNEAIREVITLSLSEISLRRIELRVDLSTDLPRVRGDRIQLQQVIFNLVLNAIEAMDDTCTRELTLRTAQCNDGRVRVSVRDSGKGLGAQDLEKVFEAFYTTKDNGMGVGLYVSRSIIASHGGCLQAERNSDCGATFSFSLSGIHQDERSRG